MIVNQFEDEACLSHLNQHFAEGIFQRAPFGEIEDDCLPAAPTVFHDVNVGVSMPGMKLGESFFETRL